jgi:hypothetical protein
MPKKRLASQEKWHELPTLKGGTATWALPTKNGTIVAFIRTDGGLEVTSALYVPEKLVIDEDEG